MRLLSQAVGWPTGGLMYGGLAARAVVPPAGRDPDDRLVSSLLLKCAAAKHPQMRKIRFLQAVVYSRLKAVEE